MCESDIKVYIRELESYLISRGYKIKRSNFDSLKNLTFKQLREVRDQLKQSLDIKNMAELDTQITAEIQVYLSKKFPPLSSNESNCTDICDKA